MDLKISIDDEVYNHFLNNNYTRNDVIAVHTALNNADPNIIRCKNCKHFERWKSPEATEKHGQVYSCGLLVISNPSPDDFCSKAEREEPSPITQIRLRCPNCNTCWENVSVPKDIWDHGKFICSKCGADLTQEKEERKDDGRWCNTCEFKHLESECLGCAEYDEYDNLINLRNYKKEDANESRWNYELWETKCLNKLQTERKKEEEK